MKTVFLSHSSSTLGGDEHGHHLLKFNYSNSENRNYKEAPMSKLLYNKGDYKKLNDYFNKVTWSDKFLNLNANDSYKVWLSIYNYGCNMFIPRLKINSKREYKIHFG